MTSKSLETFFIRREKILVLASKRKLENIYQYAILRQHPQFLLEILENTWSLCHDLNSYLETEATTDILKPISQCIYCLQISMNNLNERMQHTNVFSCIIADMLALSAKTFQNTGNILCKISTCETIIKTIDETYHSILTILSTPKKTLGKKEYILKRFNQYY